MDNIFKCVIKDNYFVDKKGSVPQELMSSSINNKMNKPSKNKGLYGGEPICNENFLNLRYQQQPIMLNF